MKISRDMFLCIHDIMFSTILRYQGSNCEKSFGEIKAVPNKNIDKEMRKNIKK